MSVSDHTQFIVSLIVLKDHVINRGMMGCDTMQTLKKRSCCMHWVSNLIEMNGAPILDAARSDCIAAPLDSIFTLCSAALFACNRSATFCWQLIFSSVFGWWWWCNWGRRWKVQLSQLTPRDEEEAGRAWMRSRWRWCGSAQWLRVEMAAC